jgi:hypothetical protein
MLSATLLGRALPLPPSLDGGRSTVAALSVCFKQAGSHRMQTAFTLRCIRTSLQQVAWALPKPVLWHTLFVDRALCVHHRLQASAHPSSDSIREAIASGPCGIDDAGFRFHWSFGFPVVTTTAVFHIRAYVRAPRAEEPEPCREATSPRPQYHVRSH